MRFRIFIISLCLFSAVTAHATDVMPRFKKQPLGHLYSKPRWDFAPRSPAQSINQAARQLKRSLQVQGRKRQVLRYSH